MTTPSLADQLPSVAIFGPQSKTATDEYLAELRHYILNKEVLGPFVQAIKELPQVWAILLPFHEGFARLEDGPRYLRMLSDWISGNGKMNIGNEVPSGMLALPLLLIIHLAQYFQFLDQKCIKHREMMDVFRRGAGVQGYCGGMMAAISVACANEEEEIVANACRALRTAVGVGASACVMDNNPLKTSCIMVLRTKRDGQAEDIVKAFPGTHISAITDSRTVSIVGPAKVLEEVERFAVRQKLTVQMIPLRGKMHQPDNLQLAADLCEFCDSIEDLKMPDTTRLLVPFRSNITTELMTEGSLSLEVARTILSDKCQWYQLLTELALDLNQTSQTTHSLAAFGIGDCISLKPFREAGLQVTKLDMFALLKSASDPCPEVSPSVQFAPDAIAVVGMACRFPGANTVEELWDVISSGKSTVQEVPKSRINFENSFRAQSDQRWASKQKFFGNFISDHDCFDNSFFRVSSKEAAYMDPQQCLLLETAYQAMESSGYLCSTQSREAGDRVGVFIGASFTDYLEHTAAQSPNAYTATGTIRAFLSGKISHYFGWTGPSEIIDTACSSSLVAISRACRSIQRKECTSALVGGVNFLSTPTHFLDLGRAGFLSPTGQCKPFDASADGYCRSEGVGLIVLKPLSVAMSNNDQILGIIPGVATNQGSDSKSITVPHTISQLQLYKDILEEAKIDPSFITYVEAHGTGTQVGDPVEIEGIRRAFSSRQREHPVHVGSIKANIGHCESSAGIAGVMKAILMVNKGVLPPLAGFKCLNSKIPAIEPDNMVISTVAQPWNATFRAICVNGYGAAGSNAAILLCQNPQEAVSSVPSLSVPTRFFPVVLTAHSKKALSMYARSLKRYLQSPAGPTCTIGNLAFTLSNSRKLLRYTWTTKSENLQTLCESLDDLGTIFERPDVPKKVVLAFSGQAKQFVGLDKQLYDCCPLLQKHMEKCNQYLVKTGSPSIFPDVFQSEPILDVVMLQCSMFTVQYAFARSWIECGLKIDAVVGHSFGELTAMAVSGILSLENAIDLIRARAELIKTKWGPEHGTMLVIHGTEAVVRDLISHLPHGSNVEIACYNAQACHVVVGSAKSISDVEYILEHEPSFRSLRSSKPDTTHGFHSRFTEPLLSYLDAIAREQTFSAPQIPLESCTREKTDEISFQRIYQHMREPVFFHHAVSRIEQGLGSCIWLEAGVDSPIIPMVKKAISSPQDHVFLPIKIAGREPWAIISDVTSNLWREGLSVSFFNSETPGLKQIWLPPYEFERTPTWLPYTDPIMEALRTQEHPASAIQSHPEPVKLSLKLVNSHDALPNHFRIGTETERFQSIVTGHNVIGHPLCPAALYLECAIMATKSTRGDLHNFGISFWDFRIDAPLGVDHSRTVLLALEGGAQSLSQSFTLKSSASVGAKSTLHAKANFKLFTGLSGQEASQFQYHQRIVKARISSFAASLGAETFRSNRAYKLFSRVVNYSSILQGISSITMAGNEVIADLDLTPASETNESSSIRSCDTIALDNFIQVVGLLINTCDLCAETEAYLATGADNLTLSPNCNFETMRKFTVYASFSPEGTTKATGDIFVLLPDGALLVTITGMSFHKLPLSTLHKILEPITKDKNTTAKTKECRVPSLVSKSVVYGNASAVPVEINRKAITEPTRTEASSDGKAQIEQSQCLKKVVAEFAGLEEAQISKETIIGDLGVDSLAAIELVEELKEQFSIQITSSDVLLTTIESLSQLSPRIDPQAEVKKKASVRDSSIVASSSGSIETSSTRASSPASSLSSSSAPSGSSLREHIINLIAEYAAIDASEIKEIASLEVLGVDSLSLIELKSAIEEAHGLEVDPDLSTTVGEIIAGLEKTPISVNVSDIRSATPSRQPIESSSQEAFNPTEKTPRMKENTLKLIAEYAAIEASSIEESASLDLLGVDSLSLIELKSALEQAYNTELDFDSSTTVDMLLSMLGQTSSTSARQLTIPSIAQQPISKSEPTAEKSSISRRDPIEALEDCQAGFAPSADRHGLTGFWVEVAPKQDELVIAYIIEAFEQLGVHLRSLGQGALIPKIQYAPKHSQLMARLWTILEEAKIITRSGAQFLRSSGSPPRLHSSKLLERLLDSSPRYAIDSKLISVTGSHLAKCLTGEEDGVPLLFGSATAKDLLNTFYRDSPLFKTCTDILQDLMDRVVPTGNAKSPFRVLEVGAGTGGTTARLCDFLQSHNRNVEYTFTDISSTLVGAAKRKFSKQYAWMDFCVLDLEKDAPAELQGRYDLVIGTNVVHATSSIVKSCTRIRSLLRKDGFLVLLELTRIVNWFDLVFGLLSGWWSAKDGRSYALQPAEVWCRYLKEAGFPFFACTTGSTKESTTQQLLIGSTRDRSAVPGQDGAKRYEKARRCEIETVPYKVVDDLRIEADIHYPLVENRTTNPMSIALMVHGGGYMTLSRRAIRPHQTHHLLANNVLPISLDYRLCPEIDIISGPMTDMKDALIWARTTLPHLAKDKGVVVDTEKIVVVGWSTGGHLAMTTAWTSIEAGIAPPKAILAFYAPTDFEDEYFTRKELGEFGPRTMSMSKIQQALSKKVISNYDGPKGVTASEKNLGFLAPGDPRSELVLSLFQDGNGLSLLLNGLSFSSRTSPSRSQIQSISPLHHLQTGTYKTPTFIIHGERDEVVPCAMSVKFAREMERKGVRGEVLVVKGKRHIFDGALKPGDAGWEMWAAKGYEFLFDVLK